MILKVSKLRFGRPKGCSPGPHGEAQGPKYDVFHSKINDSEKKTFILLRKNTHLAPLGLAKGPDLNGLGVLQKCSGYCELAMRSY